MSHLVDIHTLQRANTVVLLGLLWVGLATCVLAATFYDISRWLGD